MQRILLVGLASLAAILAAPAQAQDQASEVRADAGFGASGLEGCRTDLRYLNQMFGWQVMWPSDWKALGRASNAEVERALRQWSKAPAALGAAEAALAASREPEAAPRVIVERIIPQLDDLAKSLEGGAPPLRNGVSPQLKSDWDQLFTTGIAPAVNRYRSFVRDIYLKKASTAAGLSGTPDGARCFRQSVKQFTTLDLPPDQIEKIGRRLLNDTEADLARLHHIKRGEVPALLEKLRAERDDSFTKEQLVKISEAAIGRASAGMPRMFHQPLKVGVQVQPLPSAMEASFPAGFYEPPEGDGPATYVINRSRPQDRKLMAEVIAFHEALPGHHVRVGLGLPAGTFNSGYGEGWALYSEYLADEMGLYSSDFDRTGMMAKHLWAASRLVVEPGLHLHGWSRSQAIDFMRRHTAMAIPEIELEVDRYISTPGQSLSYMLGYDRIRSARTYAEKKLGKSFDMRDFHDVVLGKGSRPLDEMYADVVRWADGNAVGA